MRDRERRSQSPASYELLALLEGLGWHVPVLADGQGGILIPASKLGRPSFETSGPTVADIALEIYDRAFDLDRAAAAA